LAGGRIRLIFSISDLDAEQDSVLPEEEDQVEAEDDTPGPSEESFPVETSITITKPNQGALTIDAVAQGKHTQLPPRPDSAPPHARAMAVPAGRTRGLRRQRDQGPGLTQFVGGIAQMACSPSATFRTTPTASSRPT